MTESPLVPNPFQDPNAPAPTEPATAADQNQTPPPPEVAQQQIVPQEEAPLAEIPTMDTAFDGLDQEDFKLPILRIVQAQSRNAPPQSQGAFWNSVTNEVKLNPEVTIMRVAKTRIMFPAVFSADADVLCASDDSKKPRNSFVGTMITDYPALYPQYRIPDACKDCALGVWGPNNEVPPCSISYRYILVDLESGMPGVFSLKRTDITMARSLNTLLSTPGLKKLRLSTEHVVKDEGNWFAFRYNVLPPLSAEEWATISGMATIAAKAEVSADIDTEDMATGPTSQEVRPYDAQEIYPTPPSDEDIPF